MAYETEAEESVGTAESDEPLRPPEPEAILAARATRFSALAPDHRLEPCLLFLRAPPRTQADVVRTPPRLPSPAEMLLRARAGVPVLPREELADAPSAELALDLLVGAARAIGVPAEREAGLGRIGINPFLLAY